MMNANGTVQQRTTFRRGPLGTLFGLAHTLAGFAAIAWAAVRISVIGWGAALEMGVPMSVFSYAWEANAVLLWLSGIGLLRGKPWGRALAAAWAVAAIALRAGAWLSYRHYWGPLAPGWGWGDTAVAWYASAVLAATVVGKTYKTIFSFIYSPHEHEAPKIP